MRTIRSVATQLPVDDRLLELLRGHGARSVAEIAGTLDVGEATVRRSLRRLSRSGKVIRTYGGAVIAGETPAGSPVPDAASGQAKREIGRAAAELVPEGSTVVLSSGSTVLELARRLRGRHLTVITNAIDVAATLATEPAIEVVVLGGILLPRRRSLIGHLTDLATRDLRADLAFMGATAVDLDHGFMTEDVGEIQTDRAMRGIARECVILADATKLDRVAPGFMFGFDQVGTLVSDGRLRPEHREALAERGLRVVIAPPAGPASGPEGH